MCPLNLPIWSRVVPAGVPRWPGSWPKARGATSETTLGPEPEQMLETSTYEAVAIRALYTALDELPEPPLPGEWPFLRGADGLRDVKSGWKVAEAIPANRVAGVAAEDVNSALLAGLAEGVSALLVRVGSPVSPAQLERVFEGVYLSMAPVILDAGADYRAAGDAMLELVSRVEPDQREILSIDLGADPLTAALSDRPAPAIDEVVGMAARWPTTTGSGRSPSTGRRSTIWAPTRRGNSPAASRPRCPTCGCSPNPACRWRRRCADQLPAGRRRRPVLDHRQGQGVASAVGAGRRGPR